MTRLSDEELEKAERFCRHMQPALPSDRPNMTVEMVRGLIAEVRSLRTLLATPMPRGWECPRVDRDVSPPIVLWDIDDNGDVHSSYAEEAIGIGAALIRAALKARGER